MNSRRAIIALACLGLVVSPIALAAKLGDDAPPLEVKKWVKGGPVNLAEGKGKHIYVIEFWATWCGPCVRGIPHLSELQKKHKDNGLIVVSISSSDDDQKIVEDFVKSKGDKMGYVVAYEDKEVRRTSKAYMDAFGKKGIPQCFVVDKQGKIVWEGHPMFGLDEVIKTIVSGKYDVETLVKVGEKAAEAKMQKMFELQEKIQEYYGLVQEGGQKGKAAELGAEIYRRLEKDMDAHILNEVSWTILTAEFVMARDLELALKMAKLANDLTEGEDAAILDTYARALFDTGDVKAAIEYQRKAVERAKGNERMREELEKTLKHYEKATRGRRS